MTMRGFLIATALLVLTGAARAEDCPTEIPADSATRRAQAKMWFSKGETATQEGDQVAALKAYQCSLKLVPHGFTAFNMAQVAEQIGDLELAISGYNQYLLLVPDAKDSVEVNKRVESLRERLTKIKHEDMGLVAAAAAGETVANKPKPRPEIAKPTPMPTPVETSEEELPSRRHDRGGYRTAAWISYGGAVLFIAGGVVTNLLSRGEMDTCRADYKIGGKDAAQSSCDAAKPYAYISYASFGIGAAAAVLGTALLLWPTDSGTVAMGVLPEGGLSLRLAGNF